MFVVRKVDVTDAAVRAGINSMIAECFKPSDWTGDALPRVQGHHWWVAFEGRTPVGFASLRPSRRLEGVGYLSVAGVLAEWRGKGLQKRLIDSRVKFARSLGWYRTISDTLSSNVASMRSLIACGFRPFTPSVKWSGSPSAVYWTRGRAKI